MSFVRQPSSGHYEHLVAERARILGSCPPSHRRRILGLAPRYRPAKTHEITVDLRTGKRQVVTGPSAAPRLFGAAQVTPPESEQSPIALMPVLASRPKQIIDAVLAAWDISDFDLFSDGRTKAVSFARFACYWLLSERLRYSRSKIGRTLRRDHTSVISGIRRAREFYEHDADWRAKFDAAVAALDGGAK